MPGMLKMNKQFALVTSSGDEASVNMFDYLQREKKFVSTYYNTYSLNNVYKSEHYENIILYNTDENLLFLDNLDASLPNVDAFIFLSKHVSESRIPTLTCHTTGNFDSNVFGGKPKEISFSLPSLQKAYIKKISLDIGSNKSEFEIIIEATHHGPTSLRKPVLFIEIGSTAREWKNSFICKKVVDSTLDVLSNFDFCCNRVGIGLGGTHYPTKFNNLLLNSDMGFSTIIPKYALSNIDSDMLNQIICKSEEKVTHIVLDWKSLGNEKKRIVELVNCLNLPLIKI